MKSEGHALFTDPSVTCEGDSCTFAQWKSGTKVKPSQILPGGFRALERQAEQQCLHLCLPLGNQDIGEGIQHTGGTGGKFLPASEIPTGLGTGGPPAPGWDFCLQSLIQSCLMAQLRASPQIPTRGLREDAEEGRLEAEGAVPLQSHGIPSLGAGGLGHEGSGWQVEKPGFTGETWLRWQ